MPFNSAEIASLAGRGSEITTSFRLLPFLPFRAKWIARIVEFEWNRYFADEQQNGPFKRFHHSHLVARETRNGVEGTALRDVIEYEVGYGFLGRLAGQYIVARILQKSFEYRKKAAAKLLVP